MPLQGFCDETTQLEKVKYYIDYKLHELLFIRYQLDYSEPVMDAKIQAYIEMQCYCDTL